MAAAASTVTVADEPTPAGPIRVVTIARPAALNAIDPPTMRALLEAFEACRLAPTPRAVILTGAGERAFAAGADIAAMAGMSVDEARAFSELGLAVGRSIETLPLPVIAAVNGFALGGGCELALACDFIYASATARFGLPEVKLGAIPGFGGIARLVRRVGAARAAELLFTGDPIDAAHAERLGLANKVVDPAALMAEARRVATAIAARAPLAVAAAKAALRSGLDVAQVEAHRTESRAFGDLFSTHDLREGMRAFLEKSPETPKWQGR